MSVVESGLYTIKDQFFNDFPNPFYMDNKNERRPYFYLFKDTDGILWMIPMSSRVETYHTKIQKDESKRGKGNCILFYVGTIAGVERAFSICDMFPITEDYINAPFTISKTHYVVKDENLKRAIHSRAQRFLNLVKLGKLYSPLNIMDTKCKLLARRAKAK